MEAPKFLFSKKFMSDSVLIVACFSFVFMMVYQPFGATAWFSFASFQQAVWTIAYFASGTALMYISKYLNYQYFRRHRFSPHLYIAWMIADVILLSAIYTLFTHHLEGGITMEQLLEGFPITCGSIALTLAIPWAFLVMYATYKYEKERNDLLKLSNFDHPANPSAHLVHLYDNKDELKMSILSSSIYYIESQDNYVKIYFDKNGEMESYLLRCSTRRLEQMISGTSLTRCHRSYIVNLDYVKQFVKGHNSSAVVLDIPGEKSIPVSKSYTDTLPVYITSKY